MAKIIIHILIQKGEGEDFSEKEKTTKKAKKYQIYVSKHFYMPKLKILKPFKKVIYKQYK